MFHSISSSIVKEIVFQGKKTEMFRTLRFSASSVEIWFHKPRNVLSFKTSIHNSEWSFFQSFFGQKQEQVFFVKPPQRVQVKRKTTNTAQGVAEK